MTMPRPEAPDLTRITLQILWIGILIAACFWILRPFLLSIIWALMIVVATWPFMLKVEGWLWNRRGLAVTAMTIAMLILFILPFTLAIVAIIDNADRIAELVESVSTQALPSLPGWLSGIPVVGPKLAAAWESVRTGQEGLTARLAPYAGKVLTWFLSQAGSIGIIALQFLLTVIISAILYAGGEEAAARVLRFACRLGGARGREVAELAAKTIRGVALGVVGTALVQTLFGGIGLVVTGVPAAPILIAVMFMLCIAQLGPSLVLVPSVIWLYWGGSNVWGTVLLVVTVLASTLDNFIRPILIRKGANLPLVLIFAGVIGGLASFGIVGLFIGPVVLSVTFRLLDLWTGDTEAASDREEVPSREDR
jgi:predicted PurR-regulated permease PerM